MTEHLLERYINQLLRFRWLCLLGSVLFVLWAASGTRFLEFTNDSRIYFSEANPQLQALEELENTFSKDDNLLFVVAPKDGNVFNQNTLAAIAWLTEECWHIPFSTRVTSLTNFQHTYADNDELVVRDLVEPEKKLSADTLNKIREIALAEPLLVNRLISSSGGVSGIDVLITKPGKTIDETTETARFGEKLAEQFRTRHPDIDLYLTGGIMIDNAFGVASQDDMSTLVPAMYVILLLLLAFLLRSVSCTIATFLVIAFSMMTALGLTGWIGMSLNPSTVNAPTIILTLAVADSIHILITFLHNLRSGLEKREAIRQSILINFKPVTITSLTTAVGFLSMNFSDAPPFRELGNVVAMGVIAAWIYSINFLPALMTILPVKIRRVEERVNKGKSCAKIAEFVITNKNRLFWCVGFISLLSMLGMIQIQLDDDFIQYFDNRYAFRTATDFTQQNLTGFHVMEFKLQAVGSGGINEPDYLKHVEHFAQWLRSQKNVVHVFTYTDIVKRLNKNMNGDNPQFYAIPQSRELAAQYLLLYEMSLPFGQDLNNIINVDKSSSRLVVRIRDSSSQDLRKIEQQARQWLVQNTPQSMHTYGVGLSLMFAHISERNIKSMLGASFGALAIISALLILVLRSLKVGLASIIPNIVPAFMAFGLWGFLVGQVGLVVSILAALTMGIVVDDTVHFLSKYLYARRDLKLEPEDSIRFAFQTVGTALWVTTVVLVAGFLILTFSGFQLNSHMGLMTALTIIIALGMDFFFLPTLILKIDKP